MNLFSPPTLDCSDLQVDCRLLAIDRFISVYWLCTHRISVVTSQEQMKDASGKVQVLVVGCQR